jgi:predicted transposase YbfD/YdcC
MEKLTSKSLFDSLQQITDPRVERTKRHLLVDILIIAICASICGAESWEEIAEFGRAKQEWFSRFLELPGGIASHDTFRRVFLLLKAEEFERTFLEWVRVAVKLSKGTVVNIDGKELRGTHSGGSKEGLRIVSAWAAKQAVVLGQVRTGKKSNEITAIPELLSVLELSGAIVTIDAMGCQKAIAAQIQEQEADYVLSLKGNHGNLHQAIKGYFYWAERQKWQDITVSTNRTLEKGHGRIEERRVFATADIDWIVEKEEWQGLRSIVMVESVREMIGGQRSTERRYFISSLAADAKQIGAAVRGHWAIENQLHWSLDVSFGEDACRTRSGEAAENLAVVRHIGLNLLKQEKSCKMGLKGKRLKAGWDESYLQKVLKI